MKAGLLYSGGKDSSLAAYLLSRIGLEPVMLTATFGLSDDWKHARKSALALGFEFEVLELPIKVLDEAKELIEKDGYPRWGLDHIHRAALTKAAENYKVLSDGTRRDDRTPRIGLDVYRALESRDGVEYLPLLWGFGHKTLNRMCRELFIIETGESSKINKGDYEGELRTYLKDKGLYVESLFPSHTQTRVKSWRKPKCQK